MRTVAITCRLVNTYGGSDCAKQPLALPKLVEASTSGRSGLLPAKQSSKSTVCYRPACANRSATRAEVAAITDFVLQDWEKRARRPARIVAQNLAAGPTDP